MTKHILPHLLCILITANSVAQTDSAVYVSGNLPTEFDNAPTLTDDTFGCTDTLTVNIPPGNYVTSVDVYYEMEAFGTGFISDQESYLECLSTGNKETSVISGPNLNNNGVQSYQRTGLTIANGTSATGEVSFFLHGFRTFTAFPNCGGNVQNIPDSSWKVVVHHVPPPTCLPPSNLVASNATSNSIDLSWTSGGANDWHIEYGLAGFTPGTGTLVAIGTNPYTLSGLTPNTSYEIRIRDSCGVGDVSFWTGMTAFLTGCAPVSAPYSEDFESSVWTTGSGFFGHGTLDTCWSRNYQSDFIFKVAPKNFTSTTTGPSGDHTTGSGKWVLSERIVNSGAPYTAWLSTPEIDLTALTVPELTFWYHAYGADIGDLDVEVSDNGGSTWTSVFSFSGQQHNTQQDPWSEATISLSAYANATIVVRFTVDQAINGGSGDIALDDFDIHEQPTCPKPTNIAVANITGTTADVSWTTGGASNWQIEYGPAGFTPGSGTVVQATTNPYTLTGLSPATGYDVYVRDSCSASDLSAWAGPEFFASGCAVAIAPFSQNFDNPNWVPGTGFGTIGSIDTCWTRTPVTTYVWKAGPPQFATGTTGPSADHTTGSGKYIFGETIGTATGSHTAEIKTPEIDVSPLTSPFLTFYHHMYGADIGDLEVEISNDHGTTYTSVFLVSGQQHSSGADPWTEVNVNLAAYTGDTIIVKFKAIMPSFGGASNLALDDITVDEAPACPKPQNFTLDFAWITTAEFSWTGGGASDWELEYGSPGFANGTGTRVSAATNSNFLLTGLSPNTSYEIYVRDSCGVGNVSDWVGPVAFKTLCNPVASPYVENFDAAVWDRGANNLDTGTIASCWVRTPLQRFVWKAGPPNPNSAQTGPSADHTSGTGGFIYSERIAATTFEQAYIQTVPVDLGGLTTPRLSFWYHMYGNSVVDLEVDINNGSGWTNIYTRTGQQHTSNADLWKEASVDITAYVNDTVVIRFRSTNNNGGTNNDVSIDDIEIDEAPSCPDPQDLEVVGSTNTTATLQWITGGATTWNIEYGAPGFAPGTGTYITANSNPFTITGLTPDTDYHFYVRDSCSAGDVSNWIGPDSTKTDCAPVSAPLIEDFEGAGFTVGTGQPGNLANCWRRYPEDGYVFTPGQNGTPSFNTGPSGDHTSGTGKYVYSETYFSFGGFNPNVATITTPLVDLTPLTIPELRFWYHMFGGDIDSLQARVFDGTSWTSVSVLIGAQQSANNDAWKEAIVDISAFAGDTIKVEFRAVKQVGFSLGADMAIDDLSIDEKPSCSKPANLIDSNATATTIELYWTTGGATNWQIEYGPTGFTQGNGTLIGVTTNPYTVTGLNPATTYDFYVRDSCGVGDVSEWLGPTTGNTLCVAIPAPYVENFDGPSFDPGPNGFGVAGTIDACWTRNPAATYFWKAGPSTPQTGGTGPSGDHTTGSGGYIFTESGGFAQPPLTAEIESPPIDLTPLTDPELTFWYHMFGGNIGNLDVEVSDDGGATWSNVFSISGAQQTAGTSAWTEVVVSLTSYANDTIILRFTGDKTTFGNAADISIDDVSIDDAPTCPKPSGLTVTAVSTNSITVSWTTGGASDWQIEYGPIGFANGSGTLINVPSNPYTITGLNPKTGYDIYVRDSCGMGDVSDWALPEDDTTACSLFVAPYVENFDSASFDPGPNGFGVAGTIDACWSRDRISTYFWKAGPSTPQTNGTGPSGDHTSGSGGYLFTESGGFAQPPQAAEAETPTIDLSPLTDPQLSFWYHMFGPNIGDLDVEVSNDGGVTWTNVHTISGQQQTANNSAWLEAIVSLTAYAGDTIIVKFLASKSTFGNQSDIAIDDVSIDEAPNCPKPTVVLSTGVTPNSITISWSSGGANDWHIEYGPTGFTNGTGTLVAVSTNPYTITGLSSNTGYDIYVRDSCGMASVSEWSSVLTDTTECGVFTAPYSENFDGSTFVVGGSVFNPGSIDNCWVRTFSNSYFWAVEQNGTVSNNTGPDFDHTTGSGKFMFTDGNGAPQQTELWSPEIDISTLSAPELRFWYHMYGGNIDKMEIDIWDGSSWNNEMILNGAQHTSNADPWTEAVVSLSSYAGDTIRVRFVGFRTGFQTANDMALDDVWIGDSTACARPDSVQFVSATTNSITLQWSSSGALASIVRYRVAGSGSAYNSQTSFGNTITLTGLSPSTTYEISVRDSCGAGDVSLWTPAELMSTVCGTITAPWFEHFDHAPWAEGSGAQNNGDVIHQCWTRPTNTGVRWTTGSGGTPSANTGPSSDVSGSGNYIFTEATIGTGTSVIESPFVYIPTFINNPVFQFSYHMYGGGIDSMFIEIDDGSGYTQVKSIVGGQQTANNDPWQLDSVNLSAYSGDTIKLRFTGENNAFTGDIALDGMSISGVVTICSDPSNITFTNIGSNDITVNWVSGSGSSDMEVVPTGQPLGSGQAFTAVTSPYVVSGLTPGTTYDVYIRDQCGSSYSNWDTAMVTTDTCSTVIAGFTFSDNILSVNFDGSNTIGADTLQWDFGDGNSAIGTNVNNTYLTPGTYVITLIAFNACGNADTLVQNIQVCDSLVANFTTSVSNDTVSFDASSSIGGLTHSWDFGDGTSDSATTVDHAYGTSGSYTVTLIVYNECGDSDTITKTLSICGPPLAKWTYTILSSSSQGMNVQFDGTLSLNAQTYAWDFGDGNTNNVSAIPLHTYTVPGLFYKVTLTVTNSCGDTDVSSFRLNQIGLDENVGSQVLDIFPNPVRDKLILAIRNNTGSEHVDLKLFDPSGRLLIREERELSGERMEIDVRELPSGYYRLEVVLDGEYYRSSIIKN